MIKIEQVNVTIHNANLMPNRLLTDLNLTIDNGEFITVVGSTSAGKSALLNVIAGDILPNNGYILFDARDVTHLPSWRRAKWVARLFQNPMLNTCPNLTLEENLALAARRGLKQGFHSAVPFSQIALFRNKLSNLNLNLQNHLTTVISELTPVQHRAVSLLMATLQPAQVLLLDEPTASLDANTAAIILQLINATVKNNKWTTIMVTDSLQQAIDYGTRILVIHQGRILLDIDSKTKQKLTVPKLLNKFSRALDKPLAYDHLLLD